MVMLILFERLYANYFLSLFKLTGSIAEQIYSIFIFNILYNIAKQIKGGSYEETIFIIFANINYLTNRL